MPCEGKHGHRQRWTLLLSMRLQSVKRCLVCAISWTKYVIQLHQSCSLLTSTPPDRRACSRTLRRSSFSDSKRHPYSAREQRPIMPTRLTDYTVSIAHRLQMYRIIELTTWYNLAKRLLSLLTPRWWLLLFLRQQRRRHPSLASTCPRRPFRACLELRFLPGR